MSIKYRYRNGNKPETLPEYKKNRHDELTSLMTSPTQFNLTGLIYTKVNYCDIENIFL